MRPGFRRNRALLAGRVDPGDADETGFCIGEREMYTGAMPGDGFDGNVNR